MGSGLVVGVLDAVAKCFQLVSVILNGAIIFTIWRKSLMCITSTRFVFSLCLSHLIVSVICLLISIFVMLSPNTLNSDLDHIIYPEYDPDLLQCSEQLPTVLSNVLLYITFGVGISTLMTVTIISIERYITIARPMMYKSIVTPRRCFVAITLCWVLSALIVLFSAVFFTNKTKQCGSFIVPVGSFGWYFAGVFTFLTLLALTVMTICYAHIFSIAKEKCQKVQIGQFSASAPASISSDWPSSVHTSVPGLGPRSTGQRGWFHPGSRMTSSTSLLHWVLMTNLRHNSNSNHHRVPTNTPKSPELSPTNSVKSVPGRIGQDLDLNITITSTNTTINNLNLKGFLRDPRLLKAKRKWKKYLKQNYNSPRKTVCTIMLLIGSVLLTQLPLALILYTPLDKNPVLFFFSHDLLFALSSVANPILYGFLNRNIRDQLCKIFRPKKVRKRNRNRNKPKRIENSESNDRLSVVGELRDMFTPMTERIVVQSRKGSLTSEDTDFSNSNSSNCPVPSNSTGNTYLLRRKDTTVVGVEELERLKLKLRRGRLGHNPERGMDQSQIGQSSISGNLGRIVSSVFTPLEVEVDVESSEVRRDVNVNVGDCDIDNNEDLNDGDGLLMEMEDVILQNLELPRKPSQDSGADMTFSDEEDPDPDPDPELPNREGSTIDIAHIANNQRISITSISLQSIRNVENYLRIYGDTLDVKFNTKSKSDSDISRNTSRNVDSSLLKAPLSSHKESEIVIKSQSQCHLGPEVYLVMPQPHAHNYNDTLGKPTALGTRLTASSTSLRSLSSSRLSRVARQEVFNLKVHSSQSADANLNCDDLLEECILVPSSTKYYSSNARLEFLAEFGHIGNLFSEGDSDNSTIDSDDNDNDVDVLCDISRVLDHIQI